MKKMLKRAASALMALLIVTPALLISASADTTSIRFSDPTVVVGNTVTVTMTVGKDVAGYDIWLAYDSNLLQYTGSDGRIVGGGGSLHVVDADLTGQGGTMKINMQFKTLAVGTARITITGQNVVDQNADTIPDVICGNSAITITSPPTASSDSSLKSLTISPGSLSPAFSSGNKNYTVTVSSDTTSLAVSAKTNHSAARVSVSGNNSLAVGVNWVSVTVTAEDGSTTKYVIKVTRNASVNVTPDPTPEVTEEPRAYVMFPDGSTGLVAKEISEELIPAGFTAATTVVEGIEVPAITYGETGVIAVLLEGDEKLKSGFYYLDVSTGIASLMEKVDGVILWPLSVEDEPPEGYEAGKFTLGSGERDALVPVGTEEPNHCLIYGVGLTGEVVLYLYDPVEQSLQRHDFALIGEKIEPDVTPTPDVPPTLEVTPTPTPGNQISGGTPFTDITEKYVIFGLSAAVVILLFLTICFATMYGRKANVCKVLVARRRAEIDKKDDGKDHSEENELLLAESAERKRKD